MDACMGITIMYFIRRLFASRLLIPVHNHFGLFSVATSFRMRARSFAASSYPEPAYCDAYVIPGLFPSNIAVVLASSILPPSSCSTFSASVSYILSVIWIKTR